MLSSQGHEVIRLLLIFILLGWGGGGYQSSASAQELKHSPINWQAIGKGLSFAKIEVLGTGEVLETLAVVRIDPASNAFRIFHGAPQKISSWWQQTGALVLFNASYYTPQGEPCGLIVADGKLQGPLKNDAMRGMFVSEPKGVSPDLPRATILDISSNPINPKNLPWTQGVQSFPLLLDSRGRIRVKSSNQVAQRTVICTDRKSNILVFHSSGEHFTLFEMAKFLKSSAFDIDAALNLDGGSKAQLYIKTPEFNFSSLSSFEQSARELINSQTLLLPTVIGVFSRHE
jgi:uncharacterized protein YigE (DUF2233 family)